MSGVKDEELNKILNKAFEDIQRRVSSLMLKREKQAVKEAKELNSGKKKESRKESDKKEKEHKKKHHSSSSHSSHSSHSE